MKTNYKRHIFDVGAFNGADGIALALKNPNIMIHAFEANPEMIQAIKILKNKIEKRIGKKIKNYRYYNYAVSNTNKISTFYIAKNPTVSSLSKFSKSIELTWPGYKEAHCHVIKKIKVKTITLEKFCKKNLIFSIDYLHVDTQGNDLNVLKGLGSLIKIVQEGQIESAVSSKVKLYEKNHSLKDAKSFFKLNNFSIKKIEFVDENITNEVNVYFESKNFNKKNFNKNYNVRYFRRVYGNNTYVKDDIKDFFLKIKNKLI
jgi:FkbM family methyltransferase